MAPLARSWLRCEDATMISPVNLLRSLLQTTHRTALFAFCDEELGHSVRTLPSPRRPDTRGICTKVPVISSLPHEGGALIKKKSLSATCVFIP
jgi:hypothetical protein